MPRNPEVNFYLKPVDAEGKSLIFLNFKYNKNRLFFSFGERIRPADWNGNKQRAKKKATTTTDGEYSLNDLLDNLKRVCEDAYIKEKKNGIPTVEKLRKYLNDFLQKNLQPDEGQGKLFELIERFITGEIKNKGKDKSQNTLDNYNAVKQHLLSYQNKYKTTLTFESITLDFFYSYVAFLKTLKNQKKEPISINTIAKDIRLLKVFMGEAVDLKYTTNLEFKHDKFTITETETDAVYLSDKEITELYNYDLSNNKKLEQVRDLFVFGCLVGLRFSDYSSIERENIVNIDGDLFLKVITEKTKELVIIPCNPLVLEIFRKYEDNHNSLPKSLSNQKFNDYIKQVCERTGLTETGRLATNPKLPLYQAVSSHTARRSFATNLYLDGYPTIEIMKITGHKTEKAFMKYIRVTKLDAARRLNAYMKKRWEEKRIRANETLLRVAS